MHANVCVSRDSPGVGGGHGFKFGAVVQINFRKRLLHSLDLLRALPES